MNDDEIWNSYIIYLEAHIGCPRIGFKEYKELLKRESGRGGWWNRVRGWIYNFFQHLFL